MSKSSSTRSEIRRARTSPYLRPGRNKVLKRSRRRRFIRRGTALAGLAAAGLALAAWGSSIGWSWLSSTPLLALRAVSLEGVRMADETALRAKLSGLRGRNLIGIDLTGLRASLAAGPWVEDVVLRRVYPHTLSVEVRERRPVAAAVWDGVPTVVDGAGVAIVPWSARLGVLDLPLVTGLDGVDGAARAARVRTGLRVLAALDRKAPELLERLSEVDVGAGDRVVARFVDEPAPLLLDRDDITVNLDHYLAVRDDITRRVGELEAIDLRWRGRVVAVPAGSPPRPARSARPRTTRGGHRG